MDYKDYLEIYQESMGKACKDQLVEPDKRIQLQKMQNSMCEIISRLGKNEHDFDAKEVCDLVANYIHDYGRILYSEFSSAIYSHYNEIGPSEGMTYSGTIMSHLEDMIAYSNKVAYYKNKLENLSKENYDDARKAFVKMWDHVSLASQQYNMLKQSDEEYNEKIEAKVFPMQKEMIKEANSQLLTMLGIFTAVAFMIFGSITSMENIFSHTNLPIFKLLTVGCVWGLCVLNLIFIFLFCIGKMTKLNFKSTDDEDATVFQKYPVVWWTDFIILTAMAFSLFGYCITTIGGYEWLTELYKKNATGGFILGIIVIVLITWYAGYKLYTVTKKKK